MKKRIKITLLLLSISFFGFGQELPIEKSENHIHIEGTIVHMIPPTSFEPSKIFRGLRYANDQTTFISIQSTPYSYSQIKKYFSDSWQKKSGIEVITKKEIKVAEGFNSLFVELEITEKEIIFSKQILIHGFSRASTIIGGIYLKDSLQLGKKIKQSILTSFIDMDIFFNPRETLHYSLNENVGMLDYKDVNGNSFVFARNLDLYEIDDKARLVTDKLFRNVEIEDKKDFCLSRLETYPEEYSVIPSKGINEIEIDNLKGFELFAKNNENETEEMYQVILFDNNGIYYVFVGTYKSEYKQAITDIKNVIKTFSRKK